MPSPKVFSLLKSSRDRICHVRLRQRSTFRSTGLALQLHMRSTYNFNLQSQGCPAAALPEREEKNRCNMTKTYLYAGSVSSFLYLLACQGSLTSRVGEFYASVYHYVKNSLQQRGFFQGRLIIRAAPTNAVSICRATESRAASTNSPVSHVV